MILVSIFSFNYFWLDVTHEPPNAHISKLNVNLTGSGKNLQCCSFFPNNANMLHIVNII